MVATPESHPPGESYCHVHTKKLILAIVELYKLGDESDKTLACELAGYVIGSYLDADLMRKHIIGAYVSEKKIFRDMILEMKNKHPEESKILTEIFGLFLFGEKL
jgi:hypothetical protein